MSCYNRCWLVVVVLIFVACCVSLGFGISGHVSYVDYHVKTTCDVAICIVYPGKCNDDKYVYACFYKDWEFDVMVNKTLYIGKYIETSQAEPTSCLEETEVTCYYDSRHINETLTLKKPSTADLDFMTFLIVIGVCGILSMLLIFSVIIYRASTYNRIYEYSPLL